MWKVTEPLVDSLPQTYEMSHSAAVVDTPQCHAVQSSRHRKRGHS